MSLVAPIQRRKGRHHGSQYIADLWLRGEWLRSIKKGLSCVALLVLIDLNATQCMHQCTTLTKEAF
ncbi:unnamed protein product [Brassica napus]|uniref:(rape) hypothetical protein n=1 Tax=Brassica napus TaxID=3708 RepID=A0A816RIM0_BRANA|nr:unnamed protein product [Brassica napus]